ncbi:M48 family metallopeptidase [Sphingomonas daechungensis]|uniref:M48 family metallopeptidase n=1 Tax=Sphingomonas daechungensis TaxID=1176646 RepID=UPI0031EAA675
MSQQASLFDGTSARSYAVTVAAGDGVLKLSRDSGWDDEVPLRLIGKLSEDPQRIRLGRNDAPGWSLILDKPVEDDLLALIPKGDGYGRWIDRIGLMPAIAVCAVVTAVVVGIGYVAPHWVAPYVPMSWERKLGNAMVGDFGSSKCDDPAGQAALEKLAETLEPGATEGPDRVRIVALDFPIFNAVALPGGNIAVFKGALDDVDDPDALAGIVAHEIAHVRRRHVTEALIRQLGIEALISMFAGTTVSNAEQLLSLSYSRAHETEADSDAIAMLGRASISPGPTGNLFLKLAKEQGEEPGLTGEFLDSHPLSRTRAKRFIDSVRKETTYRHVLSEEDFNVLRRMCDPKDGISK